MDLPDVSDLRRVAVIGAGTIGASWAAAFLARGLSVAVWDPAEDAEARLRARLDAAWPALRKLGLTEAGDPEAFSVHATPEDACEGVGFVQESGPERLEVKRALYRRLESALPANAVVASSTSGLLMSELQQGLAHPERFAIGHPFNPPHLIPLVEVVGGRDTAPAVLDWLLAFYAHLGKHPIRINKEVKGHLANRLQAALWREAVSLVAEGVASVADVDAAITYGPGLRWPLMGPHLTFHLAGGEGGMAHFLAHLGPPIEGWWADLGAPSLDAETAGKLVEGVAAAAAGRSVAELAAERDRRLLALLENLRETRGEPD